MNHKKRPKPHKMNNAKNKDKPSVVGWFSYTPNFSYSYQDPSADVMAVIVDLIEPAFSYDVYAT
jgi:hypothetical protein